SRGSARRRASCRRRTCPSTWRGRCCCGQRRAHGSSNDGSFGGWGGAGGDNGREAPQLRALPRGDDGRGILVGQGEDAPAAPRTRELRAERSGFACETTRPLDIFGREKQA